MLVATSLVKKRGEFVLGPVDVELDVGVSALLGANGAGKTTLMQLAAGLLRADGGSIECTAPPRGAAGGVGYLPQDFAGPRRPRVRDYLRFVAWCRSGKGQQIREKDIDHALALVDLTERSASRIGSLSGGMVKRLGIAQALLGDPAVIILDEPTVGLDPIQRREIRGLLQRLGEDRSVLLSTHLSEDVASTADHVVALHAGRVVFTGSTRGLAGGSATERPAAEAVERGLIALIEGRTAHA
ncbi:ATP-binding cassette domain-containing protein [Cellulomonas sp. SLBN-39]|uniref:ATP-binding cassette domain-containing protein n=1 Tax=Cellulomonas sp. SLBN-39 TaxID=2768446 RepID=UPI00114FBB2F|nr:ATP-binding cassette domain-containing protein [Cellulomonas sp. SLBN-39]TQL01102.1 ABC-type multidrug transport system ATPase subunit [Cellulomonas sp. SLBN-39]